jgi:hypothetical protein
MIASRNRDGSLAAIIIVAVEILPVIYNTHSAEIGMARRQTQPAIQP